MSLVREPLNDGSGPGARIVKKPLVDRVPFARDPHPKLVRGLSNGLFDGSDPRPYCERCKRRPSDVIVAGPDPQGIGALATGTYLCKQCWGRS